MQVSAIIIVMLSTSVLLLSRNWRIALGSLSAHYVGIALLFLGTMSPEIVLAELVLCLVATVLIFPPSEALSGERLASLGRAAREPAPSLSKRSENSRLLLPEKGQNDELLSPVFQALTLSLCAVAAISLSGTYPISDGPAYSSLNLAFFWLWVVGLLALGITRRPMAISGGLLFILEAVQIGYLTRGTNVQPGAIFGLVAIQVMLVLVTMSFNTRPFRESSSQKIDSTVTADVKSRNSRWESRQPGIAIVVAGAALLVVLLTANDVFLSSLVLTSVALLVALFFQPEGKNEAPLGRVKFIALAVIGSACLQVAAILASEFQIGRDPLLGRIIVGFLMVGLAMSVGAFPFHWLLLEVLRRASSLAIFPTEALAMGLLSAGGFAFFLKITGIYPSLLADERSGIVLMALGLSGFVIASFIAVSRRDFTSFVAYTGAGNAGVMLAGMGADSYQGSVGAAILLGNQVLAFFLLALCYRTAKERMGWLNGLTVESIGAFAREAPFRTVGFAFASLTLLGLPPFAGFMGRWLVYTEVARQNRPLAALIAVGSMLSLLSFLSIGSSLVSLLTNKAQSERPGIEELEVKADRREPALLKMTLLSLALIPLGIGLYPPPILEAAAGLLKVMQP